MTFAVGDLIGVGSRTRFLVFSSTMLNVAAPADGHGPGHARRHRRGRAAGLRRRGQAALPARHLPQLDEDSDRIARRAAADGSCRARGWPCWSGRASISSRWSFALFKAGAVAILIDPGMGRRNLIRCLAEAEPEGFVAIPLVHAVRTLLRRRFPKARFNVTVGRRWFWGGATLDATPRRTPWTRQRDWPPTTADDPAAIIFTTGSTGPPKGVLYRHGNFDAQVEQIRDFYGIQPGEIDLPAFPLFGLFNCAMGVTAVIPDMDPSRPARVDPAKIVEAVRDWKVTQAFGSPAIWNRVGRYCQEQGDPAADGAPGALGRGAGAGRSARADEGVHPSRGRRPHALRRHRGPAGGLDLRQRSARRDGRANPQRGRRVRGPAVSRHSVEGDPHRRRARSPRSPRPRSCRRGEIGELIVRGPVVTRRVRHAARGQRPGEDRRRRRTSGTAWATRLPGRRRSGSGSAAAWPIAC